MNREQKIALLLRIAEGTATSSVFSQKQLTLEVGKAGQPPILYVNGMPSDNPEDWELWRISSIDACRKGELTVSIVD